MGAEVVRQRVQWNDPAELSDAWIAFYALLVAPIDPLVYIGFRSLLLRKFFWELTVAYVLSTSYYPSWSGVCYALSIMWRGGGFGSSAGAKWLV